MTHSTNTTSTGLLNGKIIFITGASRGIGAATGRLFTQEGAAVVLAARNTAALDRLVTDIRGADGVADAVTMDLTDAVSIRAAVHRVEELHGRLDGAFNNGGVGQQQPGPLDNTSHADIDEQFAVNFRALDRDGRRGRRLAPQRPCLSRDRRNRARRRRRWRLTGTGDHRRHNKHHAPSSRQGATSKPTNSRGSGSQGRRIEGAVPERAG